MDVNPSQFRLLLAGPKVSRLLPFVTGRGYIVADGDGATSIPGVWAGGDIVTGAATVILAMGAGKRAAAAMDRWLRGRG